MTGLTKDWIIIGAGPHGVHLACSLLDAGVSSNRLLLLDRHPEPLYLWNSSTERLGMEFLRSPLVHHLDISPWALEKYGRARHGATNKWCAPPYRRPSYETFQEHCKSVLERFEIDSLFHQFEVERIDSLGDSTFQVIGNGEKFPGRNIILALGQSLPRFPSWLPSDHPRVYHLLHPKPLPSTLSGRCVVVGAGMTGAQFSLSRCKEASITLLSSHSLRTHDFDADPCWMGPKCMNEDFKKLSPSEKRASIRQARKPGTVNHQVLQQLEAAIKSDKLVFKQGRAVNFSGTSLSLEDGSIVPCDHLFLATGFESVRPGGEFLEKLVQNWNLPVAPCGFPLTDNHLQWAPGLYVTGGLAELTLGPVARNISGARSAAKIITQHLKSKRKPRHVPSPIAGHRSFRISRSRKDHSSQPHPPQSARA